MRVVFLCAGYGTRLYPLTENKPKSLLEIGGKILLTHLTDKVNALEGVEKITLITNERFYENFCDWRKTLSTKAPLNIINDHTTTPENRLGAIRDFKMALEGNCDTDVLMIAGDNLFDAPFGPFVQFARSKAPGSSVGVYDVKDKSLAQKYGLIKADSSGKITAFLEKPKDPPTTLASMGIYYFPKESLSLIDRYLESNRNPDAPGHYISWLVQESAVFAFPFAGTWFDIGDFASYEKADAHFRKK